MIDAAVLAYYHMFGSTGGPARCSRPPSPNLRPRESDREAGSAVRTEDRGAWPARRGTHAASDRAADAAAGPLEPHDAAQLKALSEARRPPSPNLNIGQAQQVNVGTQQLKCQEQRVTDRGVGTNDGERKGVKPSRCRKARAQSVPQ